MPNQHLSPEDAITQALIDNAGQGFTWQVEAARIIERLKYEGYAIVPTASVAYVESVAAELNPEYVPLYEAMRDAKNLT